MHSASGSAGVLEGRKALPAMALQEGHNEAFSGKVTLTRGAPMAVSPLRRTSKIIIHERHGSIGQVTDKVFQFSQDTFRASSTPFGTIKTC